MFAAHGVTSPQPLVRLDFILASDIGTALAQWDEAKNFSGGEDVCLGNVIRNNEIVTNVRTDCQ